MTAEDPHPRIGAVEHVICQPSGIDPRWTSHHDKPIKTHPANQEKVPVTVRVAGLLCWADNDNLSGGFAGKEWQDLSM
ncbi:MAG: hypothetical protein ABIK89_05170, partial [Planctomycetota bacterium]